MRIRLISLLAAMMLSLTVAPALAQYPPAPTPTPTPTPTPSPSTTASPSPTPSPSATTSPTPTPAPSTSTTPTETPTDGTPPVVTEPTISCVVTVPATLTTPGEMACVVAGLLPGSTYTITVTFPPLADASPSPTETTGLSANRTTGAAVAFTGAQSNGISVTISGVVDASGAGTSSAGVPAGADTSAPFVVTLFGTAANGSPVAVTETLNAAPAVPGDEVAGGETTPATGAESGLLALIAIALVGGGGAAVTMARRRSTIEA